MINRFDISSLRSETTHQTTTFDGDGTKTVAVARGECVDVARADRRDHIAQIWLTFPGWFWRNWDQDKENDPSILKTLILRIYWDGQENPAVAAPVGDFFGVDLCETANFASQYFGMSSGGFFCRFPMPFCQGFRIELENVDTNIDTSVYANVLYQLVDEPPVGVDAADNSYFHAHFGTGENPGSNPLRLAAVVGRGHYAGCTLSMQARRQNYLGFLESPEYVYVDEDWDTPRFVGSGLEDYFLGGWYFRDGEFHRPTHGLPVKGVLNSMVAMYRVHEAGRRALPPALPPGVRQPVQTGRRGLLPLIGRLLLSRRRSQSRARDSGNGHLALLVPPARTGSPEHSLILTN